MKRARRRFTEEFKKEAVALMMSSGRRPGEVARELGIHPVLLNKWYRDHQERGPGRAPKAQAQGPRTLADLDAKIAQLEREKARLEVEHEILKKTVSIFSETRK
jgi:transposase